MKVDLSKLFDNPGETQEFSAALDLGDVRRWGSGLFHQPVRIAGIARNRAEIVDETRALGRELGLPGYLVDRQPFPGPGLAVRIVGEITREKVAVLQDADWIFREEIARAGLEKEVHQYFAVLTDMRSVGVMGDGRTYDYTVALRGVTTTDFMTADWARIPYEVLDLVSRRIVNEVRGINRIVYDITSKPPATIEWL